MPQKLKTATLIHISTDYVFNGNNHIHYTEDDITDPIGVYGKTKLAGEETIKKVGCNYIILRTAWLYSKWGNNFVKTMQKLTLEKVAYLLFSTNRQPDLRKRSSSCHLH